MATHEHPPNFEMLHGCPTPPPNASSMYGPPRARTQASQTPPAYKPTSAARPLHTPPMEFTPIGENQFRFTRARSIERSSQPSSVSGHAYAGTTPQESEHETSSGEESDSEDDQPRRRVEEAEAGFEIKEIDSDDSDDENIQILHPDHCSDAKSDKSSAALTDHGVMSRLKDLHVSDTSDSEAERIYQRKKKRWSAGVFKRTHSQSVEGESSYSDNDPQDDNNLDARRLRRKLRAPGPWDRRSSLIFEDKGFPNTNNIEEVEEPEEGVLHKKGPPSIPSDDAFTLDELPFWRGAYETMDVEGESE